MTRSVLDDVPGLGPDPAGPAAQGARIGEAAARAHRGRDSSRIPWLPGRRSGTRCTRSCTATWHAAMNIRRPRRHRRSPACRRRALGGRRRARRPRLLRDRQPPARAHRATCAELASGKEKPRNGSRSSSTCAPATFVDELEAALDRAARAGRAHPRAVPRRRPTTCSCAATTPPAATHPLAAGDRVSDGHRAGARAARGAEGRSRRRRRHVRPQRPRAPRPAARARSTMPTRPTRAADEHRVVRVQARAARSTSTSCSTAASCPTRTGSTSCGPLPGTDPPVRDYVFGQPEAPPFLDELERLIALLLPAYVREGKTYLSIGVGCTGGRHRSVVIAGRARGACSASSATRRVVHRDDNRDRRA